MKPVAIWLSDEKGQIHPYAIKEKGCLRRLLERAKPMLWASFWLIIGWMVGQIT